MIEPTATAKLLRAGANRAVNPNVIGGMRLASEIIRPETVTFLDSMMRQHGNGDVWRFQELVVSAKSSLIGKTLAESGLKEAGRISVMAVREPGQERFLYNPPADTRFIEGIVVVMLANTDDIEKVKKKYGKPVLS